ncbi:PASTA domain-containing protein [Actinoplanes sp. NPDC051861]|uniref:PASTA domain-containing protein n=1 Tax=Actinoplanes sp. NPDC051861 TaxID=3155170 RepID=UPI00342D1846
MQKKHLVWAGSALAVLIVIGCCGAVFGDDDDQKTATSIVSAPPPVAATTEISSAPAPTTPTTTAPTTAPPTSTAPPAPKLIKIPALAGENAAIAQDELEALGFTNISFGSADEDDKIVLLPQNWTVKKISPKPGKKIAADSLIVLTCTKQ